MPAYQSIAVLSLENLSPDPNEAYLADGITDELTTDLAKISSLRVISRGSVLQFRGKQVPLPEIGRLLNVQAIVEGSVTRSGDRVRVTAQLIDAAADRHLWAESYERSVKDLLGLQREVAAAIADRIQARLTVRERAMLASTEHVNPDAYLAYIKGRAFWNQRTRPALEKGVASFEEAIGADPAYARAYAGLADCYTALGYGSYLPPKVAFMKAEEAAARAIALDASLADPHASLGYAKLYYDWDFAGANLEFQRALALDPNGVTALDWHSVYLTAMGRFDEARSEILRARELDPLSVATNTDVGFVDYYSGRYARRREAAPCDGRDQPVVPAVASVAGANATRSSTTTKVRSPSTPPPPECSATGRSRWRRSATWTGYPGGPRRRVACCRICRISPAASTSRRTASRSSTRGSATPPRHSTGSTERSPIGRTGWCG